MFQRNLVKTALLLGTAAATVKDDWRAKKTQADIKPKTITKAKLAFSPVSTIRQGVVSDSLSSFEASVGDKESKPCLGGASFFTWHHPMSRLVSSSKRVPCALSPEPTNPVFSAIDTNDFDTVRRYVDGRKEKRQELRIALKKQKYEYYPGAPWFDSTVAFHHDERIKELEDDLKVVNSKSKSPFEYAVQQEKWDLVKTLLEEAEPHDNIFIACASFNLAIKKAVETERFDILPLLYAKNGRPLSKPFAKILLSCDKGVIYKEILAHHDMRRDEPPPSLCQPLFPDTRFHTEYIYHHTENLVYVFDNDSDAQLAILILGIETDIHGHFFFTIDEATHKNLEQACSKALETRCQSTLCSYFSIFNPELTIGSGDSTKSSSSTLKL